MLFQLDISDIVNILYFTVVVLQVVGSIGLVIVGVSQNRNSGKINMPIIFTIDGIIIILYFALNERLSMVLSGISGYTTLYFMIRSVLYYLIPNIISLFTFGVSFTILGIKNKQNFGKFLRYSGLFWIVFGTLAIVANSILLLAYIPFLFTFPLALTVSILNPIASIFGITASIFFLIYASRLEEKILLTSSILLLLYSISFSAYYIVMIIIA
jgi:hypothetical protein